MGCIPMMGEMAEVHPGPTMLARYSGGNGDAPQCMGFTRATCYKTAHFVRCTHATSEAAGLGTVQLSPVLGGSAGEVHRF